MKHIFGTVLATLGAATLSAATLTVTSTLDDDSVGTLRSVLASASDGDIIVFDDSLQGQTIKIVHRTHADWAIPISASVSIVGPEDKSITLDGGTNKFVIANSEFSGCRTGGAGGGSVRVEGGHECILVNCTAANNTAGSHGAGLDLRSPSYLVNCTVVGNALYDPGDKFASGGIYHSSAKLKLLNTVVVHNYYMNSDNVGTTGNIYNKISSSDLLTTASLADGSVADDEKELFAEYGTMDRIYQHYDTNPTEFVFAEPVPVSLLNNDEKRSRVVEIAKLGPLDGKGYLVKMTDDFSYVAYSKDRGATWTTFYGEESDGAKLLLHDQRGVNIAKSVCQLVPQHLTSHYQQLL